MREPHDNQAEMCAVGAVLLDAKALASVKRVVKPDHFFVPAHQAVCAAAYALADEGQAVDLVTIRAKLTATGKLGEAGGMDYLVQCCEAVQSVKNAGHYAGIVRDRWVDRTVLARLDAARAAVLEGDKSWREKAGGVLDGMFPGEPLGGDVADIVAKMDERPPFLGSGIKTGLRCFDSASNSGGLDRGFYGIFAGPSGWGKTYAGCQIAAHASDDGLAVVFLTFELDADRIVRRMVRQQCGLFDLDQARRENREDTWHSVKAKVEMWDLHVEDYSESDESQTELDAVVGRMEALHAARPRDLFVVDFVQEITVKGSTDKSYLDQRKVARRFKSFAKRTGAAVWLLSQVGEYGDREGRVAGGEALTKLASQWLSLEQRGKGDDVRQVLVCRKMREGKGKWEQEVAMDKKYLILKEVM